MAALDSLNSFFKSLAEKMGLPKFFIEKPLFINNLFLVLLGIVLVIALVLVIVLVPGKKKAKKEAADEPAPVADAPQQTPAPEEKKEEPAPAPQEGKAAPAASENKPAKPVPDKDDFSIDMPEDDTPAEPIPAEEARVQAAPVVAAPVQEAPKKEAAPTPAPAPEEKKETPVAPAAPAAPAAEEDAEAKDPDEKQAQKSAGKYEIIYEGGNYYFLLKANNGQLLLRSPGYSTEMGAKKGIDTFKKAVETGEFRIDADKNGNFKYVLRAARSQVIYYGESYNTKQSAESAVQSVKNFAFRAVIKRVAASEAGVDQSESGYVLETPPMQASDYKEGGKFDIEQRDGNYYFLLKANNNQLLLESPSFSTEQGAKNGIESFKKAVETGVFTIYEDKNGKFMFILRGARSQMRYYGESYSTKQSAESSVFSVRSFAKKAVIR